MSNRSVHAAVALAHAGAALSSAAAAPDWAADAIWYQLFVSRFCNADPANDPPGTIAWDAEWLDPQPGESIGGSLERALANRRYGGDLQGVIQRLPYLHELGINALYLNPVFQARTQHKYDTSDYRHIDDSFGVANSIGANGEFETLEPGSWRWTASDRVFLDLLVEAHRLGMRVIIDGVFNHVGEGFWAWRDVMAHGRASEYVDWFEITEWETGDHGRPVRWNGWSGPGSSMVRVARRGDGLHPDFERHVFDITRRWMDPNGDGDPADGVDGWRLDVAEGVPHGFWKRWCGHVRSLNPQALTIGEIWGDATPWLAGDEFDAVMNYSFAAPVVRFFRRGARFSATALVDELECVIDRHAGASSLAMQNLLDSHDTDRVVSMLANTERAYDRQNKPGQGSPAYNAREPADEDYGRLKLASFLQFTWPGAPMVYYGTEVGMYGADDPFDREPLWRDARADRHEELRRHYQALAGLRNAYAALRRGRVRILLADDARRVIAFARIDGEQTVIIALNADHERAMLKLTVQPGVSLRCIFPVAAACESPSTGFLAATLAPLSASAWLLVANASGD